MSRFISPINTFLPQATAARLLRVMLLVALIPAVIGSITLWARLGADYALVMVAIISPIGLAWLFLMVPGLEQRLGSRYLPIALLATITAQTLESGLMSFAMPPVESRFRFLYAARFGPTLDMRFIEPLFLLMVAVVLASWAYGRRGAWASAGLAGILMVIGSIMEDVVTGTTHLEEPLLLGVASPWSIVSVIALRLPLLIVTGYIVGTLAEQERHQTMALSAANAKLREQAAAAEQLAVARERNRLARDLHDTLAHSLAGLVVQLQAIDTLIRAEPEAARSELITARRLAQEGLQEARHAIQDLRVNPIEDLGLARALQREAVDFGDRAGVAVDVHVIDPKVTLPAEVAAQVFRIAQEAFVNIERHADAQRVSVALQQNNGDLVLRVADDGRGFDGAAIDGDRFGLTGMRERAEVIGGALTVTSAVGQGTTVELTLPV